jgi:succinyl-CoA synthetase beta subunit
MEPELRLYEYEAKRLLADGGIPCPDEKLIASPDEAASVLSSFDGPVVLKAQVLTGGRGKAGGIQFADDAAQARAKAEELFTARIKGFPVNAVLVSPRLDIERELYLGITIDRTIYKQTVMVSAAGGVDVESAAGEDPGGIIRCDLDPDQRFHSFLAISLGKAAGLKGKSLKQFMPIARNLLKVFRRHDAKLLEINPLVVTADGSLVAADARMSIDDDALYRQKALAGLKLEERHEEGELTERERQAKEWRIPYLDLDGDIGMFPGGAGYGIMGNDFVVRYGGNPANFMDSGGGPSPERIARMLVLLDENPQVKVIFGARFGGISRCDDFATGVIKFLREHGLSKPIVMRMTGNMWQEGVRLFDEARQETPELFESVKIYGIETPIEHVVKEAVEKAKLAS